MNSNTRNAVMILAALLARTPAPASEPVPAVLKGLEAGGLGSAPMSGTEEKKETEVDGPSESLPLERRLGDLAAARIEAIAQDTERRLKGYGKDSKLLGSGVFYGNDYALALKAQGETARFEWMKKKGHFFHGFAPGACLEPRKALDSPTGVEAVAYRLEEGKTPSAALDTLRTGLSLLDCGSTAVIAYYEALRGVLGDEKFDVLYAADASTRLQVAWIKPGLPHPLVPLMRPVSAGAPYRRGQIVCFRNLPTYGLKHINGEFAGHNVICVDATKGAERFAGLGSPRRDRQGMNQLLLGAYNQVPIGWDIFSDTLAGRIKASYSSSALTMAAMLKDHQVTMAEFTKAGGGQVSGRYEFRWERVEQLAKVSPMEARQLLETWNQNPTAR